MKKKMISVAMIVVLIVTAGFYMSSRSAAVEVSTTSVTKGNLAKYGLSTLC